MYALCLMMIPVCLADYGSGKIPNGMCIVIFMYGLTIRLLSLGWIGIPSGIFGALIVLIPGYLLFKIGFLGAGDVKLCGAVACCLVSHAISDFLICSLLISAAFSVIKMCVEGNVGERFKYLFLYVSDLGRSERIAPYSGGNSTICLSGPVLLSLLLCLGGVY